MAEQQPLANSNKRSLSEIPEDQKTTTWLLYSAFRIIVGLITLAALLGAIICSVLFPLSWYPTPAMCLVTESYLLPYTCASNYGDNTKCFAPVWEVTYRVNSTEQEINSRILLSDGRDQAASQQKLDEYPVGSTFPCNYNPWDLHQTEWQGWYSFFSNPRAFLITMIICWIVLFVGLAICWKILGNWRLSIFLLPTISIWLMFAVMVYMFTPWNSIPIFYPSNCTVLNERIINDTCHDENQVFRCYHPHWDVTVAEDNSNQTIIGPVEYSINVARKEVEAFVVGESYQCWYNHNGASWDDPNSRTGGSRIALIVFAWLFAVMIPIVGCVGARHLGRRSSKDYSQVN